MFEFLKHVLSGQNQFASGGLLLMLLGGVGALLRRLPEQLCSWFAQQTTMMITVKDDDDSFVWVKEWFLEQKFLKRVRRVDLDTSLGGAEMALIPAPARHFFWHAGLPFWAWFYRGEDTKGRSQRRLESLTFRTIGRNQAVLKRFVDEVVACHHRKARVASYLYVYDEGWNYVQAYSPRLLDSVILKPGEKEHLMQDLERFRASRARYLRLGVPYHRGYLLYGPPGTGKTSLVSALGAKFGMSIYAVNLTDFNDRSLKTAMNDVPEDSVILFEDIDCMKSGNRRPASNEWIEKQRSSIVTEKIDPAASLAVTLSGLLNVLDGFHAPENVSTAGILRNGMTSREAESVATANGLEVLGLHRFFLGKNTVEGLLLGFAAFTEREIQGGMRALAKAFERGVHPRAGA
jgi:chaperone BCS1